MTTQTDSGYASIIDYWFSDRVRQKWWNKDPEFDREIQDRFEDTYAQAVSGQLAHWRDHPTGRLAEILVLDQFPRNMYRNRAAAFANDHLARSCTRDAIEAGADQQLEPGERAFLYMPLMHSESLDDHDLAVRVFGSHPDLANTLRFELQHKKIIDRFGRYPHRNEILGRASTQEEREFLDQPGSSF